MMRDYIKTWWGVFLALSPVALAIGFITGLVWLGIYIHSMLSEPYDVLFAIGAIFIFVVTLLAMLIHMVNMGNME